MYLLKTQNPHHMPTKSLSFLSIFIRNLESQTNPTQTNNKSLHNLFQEAVGLREKTETDSDSESENNELRNGLRELEKEVRHLKANANSNNQHNVNEDAKKVQEPKTEKSKSSGLYKLFLDKGKGKYEAKRERRVVEDEPRVFKKLSTDMELLIKHLYQKGYFKKANFVPDDQEKLDLSCFDNSYGRNFIKFAAESFGKDNHKIAKLLSGSDLKKVVLFGCPSLTKKNIVSAKKLRNFFGIQENTVCCNCVLRHSCQFVNQYVQKGGYNNLRLADVMRVIPLYALESVPPELQVPDDVKASVSQLLKEVINLSPEINDETAPDEEGMARPGVVNAIEEFKLSDYGDSYDEENAHAGKGRVSEAFKKRKAAAENAVKESANYDWADLADNGKLKDMTVAELKYYLTAHNLRVTGKKEALISRILTHMGK
ncbi:hypothetical protein EZV62_007971 [Acer yangbiense]|uniref:SAP domain-containing protein n=1 Tax=Acer yangbiense TaxID=1000413 RepID=A0A5C7IE67_9ROSI|nr:hypothetical protein EZV62_007971 [Acer yangbiense]